MLKPPRISTQKFERERESHTPVLRIIFTLHFLQVMVHFESECCHLDKTVPST